MARIAFDMDDVITDTYAAQRKWLKTTYPETAEFADGRKFETFLSDVQHNHFWEMLGEGEFFGEIQPMEGAVETLRELNRRHELFIVTAATLFPKSCIHKYNWVQRHLPFFDADNIVFCANKSIVNVDYLIDDHAENFVGLEGQGLLFDAVHNRNSSYPDRIESWAAVRNYKF